MVEPAKKIELFNTDCIEKLMQLEPNSVDALVTDPPAGISFMNKTWDDDKGGREQWVAWMTSVMQLAYAAMKPGAHGLIWAIPRTSHWTATALEGAGFEVRDVVTHLFGSGFPKSLNVSKAIDKAAGASREVIGKPLRPGGMTRGIINDDGWTGNDQGITAPDSAKQWDGWGTALKPASEHWILVRKPLSEKTVAANVLKWGTGALNIDASRVEGAPRTTHKDGNKITNSQGMFTMGDAGYIPPTASGRFPANLLLSHSPHCEDGQCVLDCPVKMLDAQSGGNVSRFFYCAKIARSERNAGCEVNGHPTVKSKKLMSYLIKMVTPPNGTILDPFMGSGSTGVAAKECGFDFIGIEKEAEYFEIAKKRIEHAAKKD